MGTLHLAVNVCFSIQGSAHGLVAYSTGLLPFFYFLTLAPCDYVTYCQAQGLSGHTSPCGECVCFNLENSAPPEVEEGSLLSCGRTLSGHTWSTAKKFSILNLSSLHPYGKPYLGYTARRWFTLLGDGSRCSTMVHAARRWLTTTWQLIMVIGP